MDTDIDIQDVDAASESSVFLYTYEATNTVHVTKTTSNIRDPIGFIVLKQDYSMKIQLLESTMIETLKNIKLYIHGG